MNRKIPLHEDERVISYRRLIARLIFAELEAEKLLKNPKIFKGTETEVSEVSGARHHVPLKPRN